MEYVIVTPAKNEEAYIDHTIRSVLGQTVKPKTWIIVDDGSVDRTASIVQGYLSEDECLRLVQNSSSSEKRAGGSKVVRAFHVGYQAIGDQDYDFIVKLDADVTLPNNYFEEVIRCFEADPKIGLCGGYCVIEKNGEYVAESYSEGHVRGAFKSYRKSCFEDIGGLREIWSWDGIDESALRFHGWELRVLPLAVVHHRPTSKEYNLLRHSFRTGLEMYRERTDPFSLLVIGAVNLFRPPLFIGSVLYLAGYLLSWLRGDAKVIERQLGDYINQDRRQAVLRRLRQLWNQLGKMRAEPRA